MTDTIAPDRLKEALFLTWLKQQGHVGPRPHPNRPGKWVGLLPFMYTCAIIEGDIGDTTGYSDRWCYHSVAAAEQALEAWTDQPEPDGWHRNPTTGRRRNLETGEEYTSD